MKRLSNAPSIRFVIIKNKNVKNGALGTGLVEFHLIVSDPFPKAPYEIIKTPDLSGA